MFKVVSAVLLAAATIAPAQAATSIIFSPNSSVIPAFTTARVFQDFTTTAANGTAYTANPLLGEVVSGTVRTYLTNASGQAVGPNPGVLPSTGSFLAVGGATAGSYSVALTGAQVFSFVFGTLGATDRLVLSFVGGATQTLVGTQICGGAATVGCVLSTSTVFTTGRVTYDLGGTAIFSRATFSSPNAAFEIDSLASAAPEPTTWLMMILGFGFAGSALRRRKGKATLAVA